MRRCLAVLATAGLLLATALPAPSASISEVKSAGNWMQVTVEGIVTYVEPVECYIQSRDRSSGIRVIGPTDGLTVGDSVLANGTFAVVDGEPTVTGASIIPQGTPSAISPFGMTNRDIGGASKWSPLSIWDYTSRRFVSGDWVREWTRACGANNTGLLVSTWGTVRSLYSSPVTGARWMYVDDGSGVVSDLGDTGLLVYSEADVNRGDFVRVTGVSSTEPSIEHPGRLVRVIRTRGPDDVSAVARPEPPPYPFSDEFDGPEPDPRWAMHIAPGEMAMGVEPGCLTLAPAKPIEMHSWAATYNCWLAQHGLGDWLVECKVRMETVQGSQIFLQEAGMLAVVGGRPFRFGVYKTGSTFRIALADHTVLNAPGDMFYLRVRKQGDTLYGSVSYDGVAYSAESSARCISTAATVFHAYAAFNFNGSTAPQFRAHFDYFRVTPTQGGQQ